MVDGTLGTLAGRTLTDEKDCAGELLIMGTGPADASPIRTNTYIMELW